jgi:hypothetical protein
MAQKRIYELEIYTQLLPAEEGYVDPTTIYLAVDKNAWAESKRIILSDFVIFTVTKELIEDLGVGHSFLTELDYASAGHTGFQPTTGLFTEIFEEASSTPTEHILTHAAQTSGVLVFLSDAPLAPSKYTLTATTLTLIMPVQQYDRVIITYLYLI